MADRRVPVDDGSPVVTARDRILTTAGVVVVAGTYLVLVLLRPTGAQQVAGTSSLIGLTGFLLGAVLLLLGAVRRLPTATLVLIPSAIALNIVIGQLTAVVQAPLYLDSIGTIVVSVLGGPIAGMATGILSSLVWGVTLAPVAVPFSVTAATIGALAGGAARLGVFRRVGLVPVAGVCTGAVAALVSAPIAAYVFGGVTGGGATAVVALFRTLGNTLLQSAALQSLTADPLDKAVTFTVAWLIMRSLPSRIWRRFPFARRYQVLAKRSGAAKP